MAGTRSLNIELPEDVLESIDSHVRRGEFESASDMVATALRHFDDDQRREIAALRSRLVAALDEPGPDIEIDDAMETLRRHHADRRAARRA